MTRWLSWRIPSILLGWCESAFRKSFWWFYRLKARHWEIKLWNYNLDSKMWDAMVMHVSLICCLLGSILESLYCIVREAHSVDLTGKGWAPDFLAYYEINMIYLPWRRGGSRSLIRLKRIYNFWCSMLVFTPFAYCFVTLRGTLMHFPELTY
jgi:hypothetical protein